jgi:hypothetical protein
MYYIYGFLMFLSDLSGDFEMCQMWTPTRRISLKLFDRSPEDLPANLRMQVNLQQTAPFMSVSTLLLDLLC